MIETSVDDVNSEDGISIAKRYLCNTKLEPKKEKYTEDKSKVDCINCLRLMKA